MPVKSYYSPAVVEHGKSSPFSGHERAFFTGKSHLQKVGEFQEGKHRAWKINSIRVGGYLRSVPGMQKCIQKPGEILSRAAGKEQEVLFRWFWDITI